MRLFEYVRFLNRKPFTARDNDRDVRKNRMDPERRRSWSGRIKVRIVSARIHKTRAI